MAGMGRSMHHTPPGDCDEPQATLLPIRPRPAIAMLVGLALVLALDSGVHHAAEADTAFDGLPDGIALIW